MLGWLLIHQAWTLLKGTQGGTDHKRDQRDTPSPSPLSKHLVKHLSPKVYRFMVQPPHGMMFHPVEKGKATWPRCLVTGWPTEEGCAEALEARGTEPDMKILQSWTLALLLASPALVLSRLLKPETTFLIQFGYFLSSVFSCFLSFQTFYYFLI